MRRMLLEGPFRPGFKLPKEAEQVMVSKDLTVEMGMESLRAAIQRQQTVQDRVPHLALGKLSSDEWNQAHLRHGELHMSFVLPVKE